MQDRELFRRILGLEVPWQVEGIELQEAKKIVLVRVGRRSAPALCCPECGQAMTGYDTVSRRWRHLDTCQYQTILEAEVPRGECTEHGVRQIAVPWAEERSRFTALFERLAIDWMQEAGRSAVARRMDLSWDEADGIMQRAVRRGLARRRSVVTPYLGVDEKSFQKGHEYVTVVCDLRAGHVLYVADDRKQESLRTFYAGLTPEQLSGIQGVAMDMWEPYVTATLAAVPEAEQKIVFDKFHIAGHLSKAVDKVRRTENKKLQAAGDKRLKGTRYQWLRNPLNFSKEKWKEFATLRNSKLRTARAWALKETLMEFWGYQYAKAAKRLFSKWYDWAIRSRLDPIRKVAHMLKARLPNLLTYFKHPITNAMSESLNSKIQWIKYTARGFRSREGFRTAIYFHCGGLDLYPQ
jgi:transposase